MSDPVQDFLKHAPLRPAEQPRDWLVCVDLGVVVDGESTLRYLFEGVPYAEARAEGRRRAKHEAVERHLPTTYCDVYVVHADDPARGDLDPNRCSERFCDGETHYSGSVERDTGAHVETGPCPFA